ncbi:MAG: serine/threonine-protein kinase [Pirellulales bacterium]
MSPRSFEHDFLYAAAALAHGWIDVRSIPAFLHEWRPETESFRDALIRGASISHERSVELDRTVAAQMQVTKEVDPSTLPPNVSASAAQPFETLVGGSDKTDDPERFARLREVLDHGVDESTADRDVLRGLRFRILRKHAEGGLGKVSVARDEELNREVALKEIKPDYVDDTESRVRFEQEAVITGGLEHPGIVPVYGFGRGEGDGPFYAMRFIRGDGLDAAIRSLHAATIATPGAVEFATHIYRDSVKSFAFRKLLQRFIAVCDAIEYAHSRGVVHRDLKPSNVMLGDYGETLVVDWGLAKSTAQRDRPHDAKSPATPNPAGFDSAETANGATVGTPSYMSPEQAAGDVATVGPASDVYCLGTTLYHLLTGRPAIAGKTVSEVLKKVRLGDVVPAHKRVAGVPAALGAICAKAMSIAPTDRYASPRALADDLEHWLADEPIGVHRETLLERLTRWARRHKAWAQAGTAALAAIMVVLGVSIVLINGQRRTAETQRGIAENLAAEKSAMADVERDLRKKAEWQAANRLYEQALYTCVQEDAALGILALDDALTEATRIGAVDLQRSIRAQIPRWAGSVHRMRSAVDLPAAVRALARSPDGRWLVAGTNEGTAIFFDIENGRLLDHKLTHSQVVRAVAFSSDGKWLVTGGFDKTARLWNPTNAEPIGEPFAHDSDVNTVALDRAKKRLLCGCEDGRAYVWNVESHTREDLAIAHERGLTYVGWTPDERLIVTAGWDGFVRFWDAVTGKQSGEPLKAGGGILTAALDPQGKTLLTGGVDSQARLWDVETRRAIGARSRIRR